MEIILVVLFAVSYLFLFLYKYKSVGSIFNPGMIILGFYTLVAVLAIPAFYYLPKDYFFSEFNFTGITFFPYVYYFICSWLIISPVFKYKDNLSKSILSLSPLKIRIFIYFFVICAISAIFIYQRTMVQAAVLENLSTIRTDVYEGDKLIAYNNQIEHFILVFVSYFSIPAQFIFFLLLTPKGRVLRIPNFIVFILGICIVVPYIMESAQTASRGMIITLVVQLITIYSFFHKEYTARIKRVVMLGICITLLVVISYTLLVTVSRFGNSGDDSSFSSLVCYWGQPTLVFNSQVAGSESYAWGQRFFYPVAEYLNMHPDITLSKLGKNYLPCFTTLIGGLWIDYGPYITFTLLICISFGVNLWLKKKKVISMPEIYFMIMYALYVQNGALVTANGGCVTVLAVFIMYYLIKIMFVPTRKHKGFIFKFTE